MAVDHVLGEEERDPQARSGQRALLQGAGGSPRLRPEDRADLAGIEPRGQRARAAGAGGEPLARRQKVQLPDLLGQRHSGEELHGGVARLDGNLRRASGHCAAWRTIEPPERATSRTWPSPFARSRTML